MIRKLFGNGAAMMPLGLICVIGIILVPLPSAVMDFLLGLSLAASLGMLVLSLHVERTLQLSTFPSLLLITTLLRLALSIASTKLILLHAHAGQIIEVFGKIVVGGNVIVGLVIFLIITLVQFVVIAKGSERVAEVGARFTLDSMPGKQMSIEADLRGGLIGMDEARHKRQESQFHGSMDGAMKFVKGDAVATLLIALVNIIAGLAIGVGANGMPFSDALARYTILTVGDGMVAQLPSLITSVSAGILITRVSGAVGVRLSEDIRRQIAAQPMVLLLIGGVMAAAALIPGLPHLQLAALGALLIFGGIVARNRHRAEEAQSHNALSPEDARIAEVSVEHKLPQFAPGLWVSLSPAMAGWFNAQWAAFEINRARARLVKRCGLPLPKVRFFVDEDIEGDRYRIHVFDLAVGTVSIPVDCYARKGMQATETGATRIDIPFLGPVAWVPAAQVVDASEPQWWSVYGLLSHHLESVAVAHAETLLGLEETHQMLGKFERDMPELAKEALKASPLPRTAEVLRRLVCERVSIRNMRAILESLVNWAGRERDTPLLTEQVRVDLGPALVQRFIDDEGAMRPIIIDPAFEQVLVAAVEMGARGPALVLPPETASQVHGHLTQVLASQAAGGEEIALVVTPDLRRFLAKFLASRFPQVCVFAYPEIGRQIMLKPLAVLGTAAHAEAVNA
jgi:type III secretion protein V